MKRNKNETDADIADGVHTLTLVHVNGYMLAVEDLLGDYEAALMKCDSSKEALASLRDSMEETLLSCRRTRELLLEIRDGS